MKISLVIPAFNESEIITDTIRTAQDYLDRFFDDYELIIVNDGSTDCTKNLAENEAGEHTRVISYEKNLGKGGAVRTGMLAADGDFIFYTDADLAYGFEPISHAFKLLSETETDAVFGTREIDNSSYGDYPFIRRFASKCFSKLTMLLAGMHYDTQCGFKGFSHDAAQKVFSKCCINGFSFDFEALMLFDALGFQAVEIPVRIINHRESKVKVLRDSTKMFSDILKIRRRVRGR